MELVSFFSLVFFMCVTPGPNNILLLKMSSSYGVKKSFPYLFGVYAMGYVMLYSLEYGLNEIFKIYPFLQVIIAWGGCIFMFYIAYNVIISKKKDVKGEEDNKYFGFWHGVLVQSLNPKSWVAGISFINLYIELVEMNVFQFILLPIILNTMGFRRWNNMDIYRLYVIKLFKS